MYLYTWTYTTGSVGNPNIFFIVHEKNKKVGFFCESVLGLV